MRVITKRAIGFHSRSTAGGLAFLTFDEQRPAHDQHPQYLPDDVRDTPAFQGALASGVVSIFDPSPVTEEPKTAEPIVEESSTSLDEAIDDSRGFKRGRRNR